MMPVEIIQIITDAAQSVGVPVAMMLSVCFQESSFRNIINPEDKGSASHGVCQMKFTTAKNTAKKLGMKIHISDLLNPKVNALLAAHNLKDNIDRYDGNLIHGVAAYNAGSLKYNKQGKILNHKYITKVLGHKKNKPWERM